MRPSAFKALKRSDQLKAIAAALASEAESTRFRAASVVGWSQQSDARFRALQAAVSMVDAMLAEGAEAVNRKRELPKWLATIIDQMAANYLTCLDEKDAA